MATARTLVFGAPPTGAVKAADFQKITVADTALAISAQTCVVAATNLAGITFTIEAQPARLTFNSETPEATVGFPLDADDTVTIWGAGLVNSAKIIREGGTSADMQTVAYTIA